MFKIEIETTNDAFVQAGDINEICRILDEAKRKLKEDGQHYKYVDRKLSDSNGNTVGMMNYALDE